MGHVGEGWDIFAKKINGKTMYAELAASAVNTLSAAATARANKREREKIEDEINRRARENKLWFNRRYNEDALARADAQRSLTEMRKILQESNKAVAGQQSVVGGTDEAVAAQREKSNQAVADAASQIAAAAADEKDKVDDKYNTMLEKTKEDRVDLANKRIADRNAAQTQLMKSVNKAADSIESGIKDLTGGDTTETTQANRIKSAQNIADDVQTTAGGSTDVSGNSLAQNEPVLRPAGGEPWPGIYYGANMTRNEDYDNYYI